MRPIVPKPSDNKKPASMSESGDGKPPAPTQFTAECWFDDSCILDIDYFVKTLAGIRAKGVRPDLIGSIIAHYASKWLPDLSAGDGEARRLPDSPRGSPESATALWMKKRFFVETLVGVLPPEKDSVSCNFLLRLLRTANMAGAELAFRAELEKRVSWQLDQASLKELMIPAFSHTCTTLLDVELVQRLVRRFVGLDEAVKSGAALVKVAKLMDGYMAEAAVDRSLALEDFMALGSALPSHARASDDGLYRAVDTYLRAHPTTSKPERKALCRLIDCRKLSPEAALHAAQNERLPVRAVIQVLFSEQAKFNRQVDWTTAGSFSGGRSPSLSLDSSSLRCLSRREVSAQQAEVRRLREEVARLQGVCQCLQAQVEKLVEKKKGFFRWRKLGTSASFQPVGEGELRTPMNVKATTGDSNSTAATPVKWRRSLS